MGKSISKNEPVQEHDNEVNAMFACSLLGAISNQYTAHT